MDRFSYVLSMLDHVLETKIKRHITGGVLVSASLLFGSLAITVLSLKIENKNYE